MKFDAFVAELKDLEIEVIDEIIYWETNSLLTRYFNGVVQKYLRFEKSQNNEVKYIELVKNTQKTPFYYNDNQIYDCLKDLTMVEFYLYVENQFMDFQSFYNRTQNKYVCSLRSRSSWEEFYLSNEDINIFRDPYIPNQILADLIKEKVLP